MIAKVDQGIAKRIYPKLPRCPTRIRFTLHTRLIDNDSQAIRGSDARRSGSTVPPADKIAARLLHQIQRVEVEPIRLSRSESGPLLGWLLPPALQLQGTPIHEQSALRIP